MPNTPVQAAAEGLPITSGQDLFTVSVNARALNSFTLPELVALREGAVLIREVLAGLLCQPRYLQTRTNLYNAPGDGLDLLSDLALRIGDLVEDEVEGREDLTNNDDIGERAWLLIRARAERCAEAQFVEQMAASVVYVERAGQ